MRRLRLDVELPRDVAPPTRDLARLVCLELGSSLLFLELVSEPRLRRERLDERRSRCRRAAREVCSQPRPMSRSPRQPAEWDVRRCVLPRAPVPAGSHRPSPGASRLADVPRSPHRQPPQRRPESESLPSRSLSPLLTVGSSRTGCSTAGAGVDDVGTVTTRGCERELRPERVGIGRRLADRRRRRQQRRCGEDEGGGDGAAHQRMVSGVPTGSSRASRRMSWLRIRMHPCETRPGRSSGRFVPWIPTKPPAGQSVSTSDRALVPNATGP